MRHAHSPLTGITGVSMPIGTHPATEANASALTSSSSHQYDGREISPVSDEEYEGFKSEFIVFSFISSRRRIFPLLSHTVCCFGSFFLLLDRETIRFNQFVGF